MGRVEEMATEKATILLNQAIEAFLLEGSIEQRLGEVNACVKKLEDYRGEISDELDELKQIRNILASSQRHLGPEREFEITERLLSLYVGVSEGALIFQRGAATCEAAKILCLKQRRERRPASTNDENRKQYSFRVPRVRQPLYLGL